MAAWKLLSQRERERQGVDDVVQYDHLPEPFRVQVVHIWRDALGIWRRGSIYESPNTHLSNQLWNHIYQAMTRELGVFALCAGPNDDPYLQCRKYLLEAEVKSALDIIDFTFNVIDKFVRGISKMEREHYGLASPDQAIEELNRRFREHAIGYEFTDGEIMRASSKFLHVEAVKPALHLLQGAGPSFAGPLEEFLKAHEHHRKGNQKEAIAEALKSFESTMKAICGARRWTVSPNLTAKGLIQVVFDSALIPVFCQEQFTTLRCVLESGVPTVRNKTSGHGQGEVPTTVPDYVVAYALHMAAANIVFLIQAHRAMP